MLVAAALVAACAGAVAPGNDPVQAAFVVFAEGGSSIVRVVTTDPACPVLVCEHVLPAGAMRASVGGHTLPLLGREARRIVVIGDTGCRVQGGEGIQACNDPAAWPFARVAAAAATLKPDLVIHVGDYHYREVACPDGNPACRGTPWGYGWDAWDADFFVPARALLAAAPWVFVRSRRPGLVAFSRSPAARARARLQRRRRRPSRRL